MFVAEFGEKGNRRVLGLTDKDEADVEDDADFEGKDIEEEVPEVVGSDAVVDPRAMAVEDKLSPGTAL